MDPEYNLNHLGSKSLFWLFCIEDQDTLSNPSPFLSVDPRIPELPGVFI